MALPKKENRRTVLSSRAGAQRAVLFAKSANAPCLYRCSERASAQQVWSGMTGWSLLRQNGQTCSDAQDLVDLQGEARLYVFRSQIQAAADRARNGPGSSEHHLQVGGAAELQRLRGSLQWKIENMDKPTSPADKLLSDESRHLFTADGKIYIDLNPSMAAASARLAHRLVVPT